MNYIYVCKYLIYYIWIQNVFNKWRDCLAYIFCSFILPNIENFHTGNVYKFLSMNFFTALAKLRQCSIECRHFKLLPAYNCIFTIMIS